MTVPGSYGMRRTLHASVQDAEARLREALQGEGFGVLTEIDVRATLAQKLGVEFRPYRILGTCNPPLAHQALSEELEVGLLLPCNVIVYEGDAPGTAVVSILDPELQLSLAGRDDLAPAAADVKARMERVLAAL